MDMLNNTGRRQSLTRRPFRCPAPFRPSSPPALINPPFVGRVVNKSRHTLRRISLSAKSEERAHPVGVVLIVVVHVDTIRAIEVHVDSVVGIVL